VRQDQRPETGDVLRTGVDVRPLGDAVEREVERDGHDAPDGRRDRRETTGVAAYRAVVRCAAVARQRTRDRLPVNLAQRRTLSG